MKRLIVICAALLLWAGSVSAKGIAGVIKGQLVSDTSGACDVSYSSYCLSGNCECARFSGDTSGSRIGRGSVHLLMTIDHGRCFLVYALQLSSSTTCLALSLS